MADEQPCRRRPQLAHFCPLRFDGGKWCARTAAAFSRSIYKRKRTPLPAHENGNQDDDRWVNLKLIKPKKKYDGAYLQKWGDKWQAKIIINGKGVHLGFFDTPDAYAAWLVARKNKEVARGVQRMIDREVKFLFTPRSDEEIAALCLELDKRLAAHQLPGKNATGYCPTPC